MKKILIISVLLLICSAMFAGTLIFKDGTKISGVDILSISDGQIIIEKDKAKRTYAISKIKSFYGTDVGGTAEEVPGEFADYTVKLLDVKMPKKGVDTNGKTTTCEIQYSIARKGESKRIKVPYFYLFVITPGKNEVSGREVHRYFYPKQAKPKGKDYDEAAIMAKLSEFSRPVWDAENNNLRGKLQGKEITFELSGIKDRPILAWYLEIWGNTEKQESREEDMMQMEGRKVGKNWWKRL